MLISKSLVTCHLRKNLHVACGYNGLIFGHFSTGLSSIIGCELWINSQDKFISNDEIDTISEHLVEHLSGNKVLFETVNVDRLICVSALLHDYVMKKNTSVIQRVFDIN